MVHSYMSCPQRRESSKTYKKLVVLGLMCNFYINITVIFSGFRLLAKNDIGNYTHDPRNYRK
ncbi:hypothetical protein APHACPA_1336 [Rickettsia amblyommatis str. Ac/Pa]|uniref:Uncharacterized protein n=1 Tax=Rickettsia amblyommatis str. Ac/Pa TaxID=1359164 RepID=A0A0F3N3R6_RICAM|nr:hypothetical protein APHACPA_1336 [Rickettsia amblyommatis str. Ac/Pa]